LVRAAVGEARAAALPRAVIIDLPRDAAEGVPRLAGRRGRLRLVKVLHSGFERTEQLVPVAVLADTFEVLDPDVAHALFRGTFRDASDAKDGALSAPANIDDDALADATEEVLFGLQSEVDRAEHDRFERASRQAETFLEDRIVVLRRQRYEQARRLNQAIDRRDGAMSSEARTEAEGLVTSAQELVDELTETLGRLERRDDERFRIFREHIHQRRYAPPRVEHLFDVEFTLP
jgi:hypothetical protein